MKFPIGVIIDSFRTDIPTAVKKAAKVGAQGIQVLSLIHISEPTRPY